MIRIKDDDKDDNKDASLKLLPWKLLRAKKCVCPLVGWIPEIPQAVC